MKKNTANFEKQTPTTQEEARQYAIDWQQWASEQDLSMQEVANWGMYFAGIAEEFDLVEEFEENGII